MVNTKFKHYQIRRVDVSKLIIRMALEADEENFPEWFEAQAQDYFVSRIFRQLDSVGVDEVMEDYPFDREEPVIDPHNKLPTYYISFHGEDTEFGDDFEDTLAYVVVLIDAKTGEAYAVDTEGV